jgi:PKD repeat protein
MAERYSFAWGGLALGEGATDIKALNPNFQFCAYNSGSDNTVPSDEDDLIAVIAAEHGTDAEECYIHYMDDTTLRIQDHDVFIPGWPDGSAEIEAEARVVVYYYDLSRRGVGFSTFLARQVNKEVMLRLSVHGTFYQTDLSPDGILLDNSASVLYNTGTVLEGGHVAEDPAHSVAGSTAFQSWRWQGYRTFLHELRDTLHLMDKALEINVSNNWTDDYVTYGVADFLALEFCYDPVRSSGLTAVSLAWQRDSLAAAAGIHTIYCPAPTLTGGQYGGTITYAQALLGDLAWTLATRTPHSLLFIQGSNSPCQAGWDTLTWRGCIEVVKNQLGLPSGDPYLFAEGIDPVGNPYRVYARNYDSGLVLLRNRGSWNQGIEPETAVQVPLPSPLAPVSPEGEIGTALTTISLRNGTAAILLGEPGEPPDTPPTANFSGNPRSGTTPLSVSFTDQSTNNPTSWSWTFGDGGTSTSRNPSHPYAAAGTYTVTLTATNTAGSDSEIKANYITVTAAPSPPQAQFAGNPTSGTAPLAVTFTDQSTNNPTSWSWTFGDGGTSTSQSPSHSYAAAGSYTVALTATNAGGSDTETKVSYITVTEPPTLPSAEFVGTPRSGAAPFTVTFTDQSTNNPTSWSWDFGEGGTADTANPTHTYEVAGTYSVALTVTNDAGADSEIKTAFISVTAPAPSPKALFSCSPGSGTAPLTVSLSDESTHEPTSWSWTFGDGGTSTDPSPRHTYETPGRYTVALTVANTAGADTETRPDCVVVTAVVPPPPPPEADFTGSPTEDAVPLTVYFTDLSTYDPSTWSWDFGDGETSSDPNPSHTYETPGSYTVTLTVSNAFGLDTETKADYITATPMPSDPGSEFADFAGGPTTGPAPLTVSFTDRSTGQPTSWSWFFGDAATSTEQHPIHTYTTAGQYTVSLTVTNADSSYTETKVAYVSVAVPPSPPVAGFSASPTSGTAPLTIRFTDGSTNGPTSWSWDFGDGWSSVARNPSHTYSDPGTYSVSLTATNADGLDVEIKVAYITVTASGSPPTAYFEGSPLSGTAPLAVDFVDRSTDEPTAWSWTFGDGGTSTERNPHNTYTTPGIYTVVLRVSNADGEDTLTRVAYIRVTTTHLAPQPDFVANPTIGTAPLSVDFTDQSDNRPTSWSWDFGDGETSTAQNPNHIYVTPGSFTVVLVALGAEGAAIATKTGYITVTAPRSQEFILALSQPSPVDLGNGITYTLPREGHVRLELFSLDGRHLALLDEGDRSTGEHRVPFRFVSYSAGGLFLRLNWTDQILTRRVILMK